MAAEFHLSSCRLTPVWVGLIYFISQRMGKKIFSKYKVIMFIWFDSGNPGIFNWWLKFFFSFERG